ncbi:MAG: hypothetical protein HUJ30_05155, partial [Gammaproteobacteria bacterium]|nr:hypothetical protein [Gammaproteobacteria bacterium]
GKVRAAILDVVLPGEISGLDLAKNMLADQPALPILFVTGLSDPRNEEMLRRYGDYMRKEFFFDTAQERIQALVSRIH